MSRIPTLVVALSLCLATAACAHPRERRRPIRLETQARVLAEQASRLRRGVHERRGHRGRNWRRLASALRSFETAAHGLERALERHHRRHRSVERALERVERRWWRLGQAADSVRRLPPRLARGLDELGWRVERLHIACERPWRRPGHRRWQLGERSQPRPAVARLASAGPGGGPAAREPGAGVSGR